MGKISGYSENTNPSRNDFALGETASGPATNRFKYDNVLKLAKTTDLSNPYKFRAYWAAGNSNWLGSATATKIPFDTLNWDTSSNYDTVTNHRFTAPVSGYYHFQSTVLLANGSHSDTFAIYLYVNGSTFSQGSQGPGSAIGGISAFVISDDIKLTTNDYVEVYVYNGVVGTTIGVNGGSANTYFSGHLISLT
jgi:C1q domain